MLYNFVGRPYVPLVVLFDCPDNVEMLTGLKNPIVEDVFDTTIFLRMGTHQLGANWFHEEPESDYLKIEALRLTIMEVLGRMCEASGHSELAVENPSELVKLAILAEPWCWRLPFLDRVFDGLFQSATLWDFDGYNILSRSKLKELEEEDPLGLRDPVVMSEAGSPVEIEGLYEVPLEKLPLGIRTHNLLKRCGINTVSDLKAKSEEELGAIPNFGKKSMDEVIEALHERGEHLRED